MVYLSDGSQRFTSHVYITGRIGDRKGNFVVEDTGMGTAEKASGTWKIIADSAAGDLPKRKDRPFSAILDNMQKYVASTTLSEPLSWSNSTLLKGDAAQAVARLKGEPGKDLVVMGSGELVQSLMRANLVDEYVLLIHPLVLGSGRRLFPDGGHSPLSGSSAPGRRTTGS